jgi:hypothetical protein
MGVIQCVSTCAPVLTVNSLHKMRHRRVHITEAHTTHTCWGSTPSSSNDLYSTCSQLLPSHADCQQLL